MLDRSQVLGSPHQLIKFLQLKYIFQAQWVNLQQLDTLHINIITEI